MTTSVRIDPRVIHKSDPTCLARYKAERIDGVESENEAAKVGSACARACEALAYLGEEADAAERAHVARQAVDAASLDLAMSPDATHRAREIMERALAPTSRLRFGHPTDGWKSSAEWRWALGPDWKPLQDPDDSSAIAAGTCDLVLWHEEEGRVIVVDDKTTIHRQTQDELRHAWEPRVYCLAAIQVFGVRRVTFRWRNLRHGYAVQLEFDREDPWFESTKERILELRTAREVALEMDAWPETLGPDCAYCPVRHRCGAMRSAATSGRVIPPDLHPRIIGQRMLALRALVADYERRAEELVEATQQPIDLGAGIGLGMRPATVWGLVPRFEGPAGYDRLMRELADLGMTEAQRVEWFRFCPEHLLGSRVRRALYALLDPKVAGRAIEDSSYVEPSTRFELGPWLPATGKRPPARDLDEILDDSWGA